MGDINLRNSVILEPAMTDRSHIETVQKMLDEAVASSAALNDRLTAIRLEMTETIKLKELSSAKVDTFRDVLSALTENEQETANVESNALVSPYSRRMRLGSKKRVVYELIEAGAGSLQLINNHLTDSSLDIDSRYVREVVRSGISEGDFSGDLEGKLVITASGKEIVSKAPHAGDWREYAPWVAEMRKRINTEGVLSDIWWKNPATGVAGS